MRKVFGVLCLVGGLVIGGFSGFGLLGCAFSTSSGCGFIGILFAPFLVGLFLLVVGAGLVSKDYEKKAEPKDYEHLTPMVFCPACNTQTPVNDPKCIWCNGEISVKREV